MAPEPVAVVTGASSGIGRAVAARLAGDGWDVLALSRRDPGLTGVRWRPVDLADPAALLPALADLDRVDAVVHAAGVQRTGRLGSLDLGDATAMLDLHVTAAVRLVDALADRLVDGGRVLLLGSRTASGVAGKSLYAASKSALTGLTRSWAMELAPRGITVNVLAPGPTDTPMLADPARAATPPAVPPLGRLVQPEEVAAWAAFLLGPAGAMVTGQQVVVCGGASLT